VLNAQILLVIKWELQVQIEIKCRFSLKSLEETCKKDNLTLP